MKSSPYPIYLDYASTGPVDPAVFEAMRPYFLELCGNSAARHSEPGWRAEAAVEFARKQIANAIGAALPQEVIFTSGATESNNLAVQGFFSAARRRDERTLENTSHEKSDYSAVWFVSPTEHRSVRAQNESLQKQGVRIEKLQVDKNGTLDLAHFESRVREVAPEFQGRALVSVMAVNNEVGNVQPLEKIGQVCAKNNLVFHVDAVQALGKIPVDVDRWNASLVTFCGHKLGGPQGIGGLYMRRKKGNSQAQIAKLEPLCFGGGHEYGLRPGTHFLAGIVGLGKAVSKAHHDLEMNSRHYRNLALQLTTLLKEKLNGEVALLGPGPEVRDEREERERSSEPAQRIYSILKYRIVGVDAASLMTVAKKVAISSGSACSGVDHEPSPVLLAMGFSEETARECIRISFGPTSTVNEVEMAAAILSESALKLREASEYTGGVKK